MSKLDEVIKQLENISFPFENSDWSIIEDCTETLRELNKPVQYTVEVGKVIAHHFVSRAELPPMYCFTSNGQLLVDGANYEMCKLGVLEVFNSAAITLALPPITIEQITFVEV